MPAVFHTQCQGWRHPPCDDPSSAFQELGVQAGRQGTSCQARLPWALPPTSGLLYLRVEYTPFPPDMVRFGYRPTQNEKKPATWQAAPPPRLGRPSCSPSRRRDLLSLLSGAVKCLIQAFIWHPQL